MACVYLFVYSLIYQGSENGFIFSRLHKIINKLGDHLLFEQRRAVMSDDEFKSA